MGKEMDNTKVLTLLIKRPEGILALLNNECKFPKVPKQKWTLFQKAFPQGADLSFLQKVYLNHSDNKNTFGKARSKDKAEFCVKHYCGATYYCVGDFVSKNRRMDEKMATALVQLMISSQDLVKGNTK